MPTSPTTRVIEHIRRAVLREGAGLDEGELLGRFIARSRSWFTPARRIVTEALQHLLDEAEHAAGVDVDERHRQAEPVGQRPGRGALHARQVEGLPGQRLYAGPGAGHGLV